METAFGLLPNVGRGVAKLDASFYAHCHELYSLQDNETKNEGRHQKCDAVPTSAVILFSVQSCVTYETCCTVLTVILGTFAAVVDPNRLRCLVQYRSFFQYLNVVTRQVVFTLLIGHAGPRVGRSIAVFFSRTFVTRWREGGQPHAPAASTPGKDPIPIVQEAGWAPWSVWKGGNSRPHRHSIPDRPARRPSLYRLSYPARML